MYFEDGGVLEVDLLDGVVVGVEGEDVHAAEVDAVVAGDEELHVELGDPALELALEEARDAGEEVLAHLVVGGRERLVVLLLHLDLLPLAVLDLLELLLPGKLNDARLTTGAAAPSSCGRSRT